MISWIFTQVWLLRFKLDSEKEPSFQIQELGSFSAYDPFKISLCKSLLKYKNSKMEHTSITGYLLPKWQCWQLGIVFAILRPAAVYICICSEL